MDQEKSRGPALLPDRLAARLATLAPGYPDVRLCVAFSGGVDSASLLHAGREIAARHPSMDLRAVHVDHGLQPESFLWAERCRELCQRLGVPCTVIGLGLVVGKGASIEAEARRGRYAALTSMLGAGECLLTAHHADDQLETVLLQLFRGAGAAGLAAMPASSPLGAGLHLRPLLEIGRDDLVSYAAAVGLCWTEDPMNADSRFDRAYLRHEVLPAIRRRWPAVARTVCRSARHLAEAQQMLQALAAMDGARRVDEHGRLEIAALAGLARERQVNVLRWWIATQGLGVPSAARLESIRRDVLPAQEDAQPVVTWPRGEVRRYRGRLYAMQPLGSLPPAGWEREIRPGETVMLPAGLGEVSLAPGHGIGIDPRKLAAPVNVRFRRAGDALDPGGRRGEHGFRKLCQEAGVAPWLRDRLPCLSSAGQLVAIAGLGVDGRFACPPGEAPLHFVWRGPDKRAG